VKLKKAEQPAPKSARIQNTARGSFGLDAFSAEGCSDPALHSWMGGKALRRIGTGTL